MMAAKKSQAGDEKEASTQPIADNRKAFHDYHILETFEADRKSTRLNSSH